MEEKDIVIIGGGPAGYVAAIRASQLGGKITLVEGNKLGGICLNTGCIPTKFLLHSAELYESTKTIGQYGISITGAKYDLAEIQVQKNRVISTLVAGVQSLLEGNKVEIIKGQAKFTSPKQLEIDSGQREKQVIQAKKVIIATGSKSVALPIPGADSPDIMNTWELLNLDHLPKSLVMIGGGVVGVEMATILAKLGCKVTIVEMMPHILPTQDAELASILGDALKEDSVEIYCGARVSRIEGTKGDKSVILSEGEKEQKLEAETVAVSVGQKPNIEDLGLDEAGVAVNKSAIQVNKSMETSVPNIYAAGDAIGGLMLAYVAMDEGMIAAENAMGRDSKIDYQAIPQCIFTLPSLASVGLTEEEAIAQGHEIRIGRFPFVASGMAVILGEQRGLVKIITEQKYDQILGVHIIGPRATDLIPEATLAMKLECTPQEIVATMHAHPTLSEALREAALDVTGETIHFSSQNR
ncbi:dihydrolipoyl dehydrogenase [Chloroflexota bacterium]